VTLENLGDYLALPNVGAVGGSWITSAKDLAEQNWRRVSMLARDARRRAEAALGLAGPSRESSGDD
jgi:2-dehydro-3-deoxyphosphogluconate aldolase/(4S)-4-hydroxy-2-oxoglutarate aldolase